MKMSRRSFLRVAGFTGSVGLVGLPRRALGATAGSVPGESESSVLVDTTLCLGCRGCEAACAEANHLPDPPDDEKAFEKPRQTGTHVFTVVNRSPVKPKAGGERFAKTQCMHCVEPACASACPVRALDKKPNGPVTYDPSRCMGCRYCMVACPFGIPKYEYEALAPRVRKCTFCAERQAQGKAPACVSVCPSGALTLGKRGELLAEARRRVYGNPDKYVQHIYGEHEAGGTNWLYVTDVPFEQLGLAASVGDESYPKLVKGALGVPPFVMTLWPPLLMGLYAFSHRRKGAEEAGESGAGESHH
ncbi:MAG TPA: 4Fe-4S dicluster domain-containing protein [Anaeromyxobacteraceae bacterium]|nr:4Fe-4S dicluster domain-containing protein [Anaeromyxobacteraceae bacterium]